MTARTVEETSVARAAGKGWQAFGAEDDHLRLTVLIASTLRNRGACAALAEVCMGPQSSWSDRLSALRDLLESEQAEGQVLVDVDALAPRFKMYELWDNRRFVQERRELRNLLVESGSRRGWTFIRPAPQHSVTLDLSGAGVAVDHGGRSPTGESPELRRLVRRLLEQERVREGDLVEFAEEAGNRQDLIDTHVVRRTDQRLSPEARDAALRLSLLRPAQALNGSIGIVPIDGENSHRIDRSSLDELLAAGLVDQADTTVQMPRAVRRFYRGLAEGTGDIDARNEHWWFAKQLGKSTAVEDRIEQHYHSVCAHSVEEAFETATYYVADIRALAVWLSRKGSINENFYAKAAEIFGRLWKLDPSDAYAWEYWAYNTSRSSANPFVVAMPPLRSKIREAYETAWRLEVSRAGNELANPLYHGRWLGFRGGECEEDVFGEFVASLNNYRSVSEEAMAWFAKPVIQGIRRSPSRQHRETLYDRVVGQFGAERVKRWEGAGSQSGDGKAD